MPAVRDLLAGIFGASPYLTSLIERNPASLQRALAGSPERRFAELVGELDAAIDAAELHCPRPCAPAPVQGGDRAPDRAQRPRRRLAGHDGGAPPVGGGRCRRRRRRALLVPPGAREGRLAGAAGRRRASEAPRLHRAGHGQARRLRAQLLLRHRPHRLLRPGARARARGPRGAALPGAPDARPRAPRQRAHRARLRVPHRPAPAPRPRLHAARHLHRRRAQLLRIRRAELGARRPHQGAPRRRRHRRGAAPAARPVALHLAQVPRLRGHRRHPRHEAADPRRARLRADRGGRARHQARARRHPRDRVLRPDPAADRRRPAAGAARGRDAGGA